MNIGEIFENAPKLEVKTIMTDSRIKGEAGIFFCIRGMVYDGHDFIEEAVRNGAICVVISRELEYYIPGVTYIMVSDTVAALNDFADVFYGQPTRNLKVYGIAGSDGKGTVAMIVQCLSNHFTPTAYIGSRKVVRDNVSREVPRNEMNHIYYQKTCRELKKAGCTAVAMEIETRYVEARFMDGIRFDYISFTNLNKSKMDYIESDDRYFASKLKLFSNMNTAQKAIINIDDEYGTRLAQQTNGTLITYGFDARADYRATGVRLEPDHTEFILLHKGKRYEVYSNLIARFNIYNLVNALAILHEDGYPLEQLVPLCRNLTVLEGSMQCVKGGQPFNIIIDSTRTLDSFSQIMDYTDKINRQHKRIICVFSLPGGRETGRRREYGKLADQVCDLIILTVSDCRMESPEDIAEAIRKGINEASTVYIEDRYTAIRQALELANPQDTVLILGKGNEDYLDIRGEREYWMGDVYAARSIIADLYGDD